MTFCIDEKTSAEGIWWNLATPEFDFDNKMYSYWCGANTYVEFNYNYAESYRIEDYGFTSAGVMWNEDIWLEASISALHI